MSKLESPPTDIDAGSPPQAPGETPRGAGRRYNPLVQLTLARIREFIREPEALFWVFIFPVLLAFALGIAFRNTAPQKNRIAIEADPANPTVAQQLAAALNGSPDIQAFAFD